MNTDLEVCSLKQKIIQNEPKLYMLPGTEYMDVRYIYNIIETQRESLSDNNTYAPLPKI